MLFPFVPCACVFGLPRHPSPMNRVIKHAHHVAIDYIIRSKKKRLVSTATTAIDRAADVFERVLTGNLILIAILVAFDDDVSWC
eukprot:SAG31_NODE_1506_length_8076_cov_13.880657_4_plen_84_part_00